MFRFLIPPAVILLSKTYIFSSFGSGEYDSAFLTSTVFILITAIAAACVDAQILLKMFGGDSTLGSMFTSKRDMFVMVNWLCSAIVLFALPYVMSHRPHISVAVEEGGKYVLSPGTKAAIILGFSSISYLMGYFGILLEMKRQDARKNNAYIGTWKQFVPPLFYIGITVFAFRAHSTIAALIATVFFAVYLVNVITCQSLAVPVKEASPVEVDKDISCRPTNASAMAKPCDTSEGGTADARLYKLYSSPAGNETKQWLRQIGYDLTVYILPMTAIPLALPILQVPMTILCVILTIWKPIYEYIAKSIFLRSSPPQEPHRVADRKKTYPAGSEFPKGWFRILDSDDLPRSRVKYVQAVGRDLAVFRGDDGIVRCLDAYCIHLGANMAVGGEVVGNCLQCPFHKWTFAGDGACSSIPYQPKVPSTARTRAYYVTEFYGIICVWIGHDGDAITSEGNVRVPQSIPPDYFPPALEKIDSGSMVLRGSTRLTVNMHLQEFAENSTDFAHFMPLHGTMCFPFTLKELPMKLVTINHIPDWKEGTGDEAHMAWFFDKADLNIFGKHRPETGAMAVISFIGPGGVVYFTFDTPIGSLVLFQTNTPIADGMKLEVAFRWYADATMPRFLVWYIVGNWIAQYQNDIMVWENKKFLKNPLLVKGDGPMNKQRRWFKQFYERQKPVPPKGSTATSACDAERHDW